MNSKIIIVILASLFFTNTIFGQDCYTDKKHEINLGYFNVFELINSHNLGIGYKYHFNQSAIRLNGNIDYNKNDNNDNNDYWFNLRYNTINYLRYDIKLGYERNIYINKFQFFYGIDGVFKKENEERNYSYTNNSTVHVDIEKNGYGISPFVGLKFFINKRVSISSETNINLLFKNSTKNSTIYSNPNNQILNTDQKETSIQINPLGLITINFHL